MKKVLLLLLSATLVAGCGGPEKKVLGVWEKGSLTLEFLDDRTFSGTGIGYGTWAVLEDGRIKITIPQAPRVTTETTQRRNFFGNPTKDFSGNPEFDTNVTQHARPPLILNTTITDDEITVSHPRGWSRSYTRQTR